MICFAVSHFVEVVTFSLKVQKKMICRETARKQTGLDDGWVQLDVDKTGAWAAFSVVLVGNPCRIESNIC